jgi:predicted amino acid-binding ACT domain protein
MTKFAFAFLLLAGSMLTYAQDKPTPKKEPTVAEMKLQLAQKSVEIADLKEQLLQATVTIGLLRNLQYQEQVVQLAKEKQAAQQAVKDAQPPEPAKSVQAH